MKLLLFKALFEQLISYVLEIFKYAFYDFVSFWLIGLYISIYILYIPTYFIFETKLVRFQCVIAMLNEIKLRSRTKLRAIFLLSELFIYRYVFFTPSLCTMNNTYNIRSSSCSHFIESLDQT